jgi:hypothetical protein
MRNKSWIIQPSDERREIELWEERVIQSMRVSAECSTDCPKIETKYPKIRVKKYHNIVVVEYIL